MPQDAGSIYSEVRVLLDKLRGDVKEVDAQFDKIVKTSETDGKKSSQAWTDSFNVSKLAGVAAFTAISKAAGNAIGVFADYQQSIANVASVSGATGEELLKLEKAAEEAGETTRFKASQAADALYYLASAGLNATDSAEALNGVLLLAGATNSDLAFAAQTVTSTLSQFNIEASNSARVSNVFAAATANSQANMEKLADSLTQVGPVANGLNLSLEETVGALQILYNAGFKGESAGRALKSALADLANEGSATNQVLSGLGVSFDEVNPAVLSLEEVIGNLSDAGLSTAQVLEAFGKEAGPQLATLISKGGKAIKKYTDAVTDTNAAAEQYAVQNDTLAGELDKFSSQAEAVSLSLTRSLEPILRGIIDLGRNFLAAFNKIPGAMKAVAVSTVALAAGLGGLNSALGLLGVTLTGPVGVVIGLTAATAALIGFINKSAEMREARLAEEFGAIAEEVGITEEGMRDFVYTAEEVAAALGRNYDTSFESVNNQVRALSENLGVSEEAIAKIGLASEFLSDSMKEQLEIIRRQNALANETSIQDEKREIISRNIAEKKAEAEEIAKRELALAEELARAEEERRRAVIEGRQTAKEAYDEEIDLINRRVALDLTTNEDALNQKIDAENAYQAALLKIGYDGLANRQGILDEGDKQLLDSIERRKALEEEVASLGISEASKAAAERINLEIKTEQAIRDRAERQKQIEDDLDEERKARNKEILDSTVENLSTLVSYFSSAFSSITDIVQSSYDRQIDAVEDQLQSTLDSLDAQLEAELEARGLSDETELESLERQLEEAIAAGDAEEAALLEKEIAKQKIIEEYDALKAAAEASAAKQTADLEYKSALATWKIQKATAAAEAALAILKAAASAPWPYNLPLIAGQTAVGALQIAAIQRAKPSVPALATGGVILPASGGVPTIQAENGFAEFSMNAGPEGQAVMEAFASKIAEMLGDVNAQTVINLYTPDEKFIAQYITRGSQGGDFTIDPRVLRGRS